MDASTLTDTTFTLFHGTRPIPGTVTYKSNTATFVPTTSLVPNTTFTATITTGAKSAAGRPLAADFVWQFTTGATLDSFRPTVTGTSPADLATNVAINPKISASFSAVMDPASMTTATFLLVRDTTPIAGTVTYTGTSPIFTPASNLAPTTRYTATVTTGAKDSAGNALASPYSWSFTTGQASTGPAPIGLGSTAYSYAILAGTTITNTGATFITGDIGVGPSVVVKGFPPGTAAGTIHVGSPHYTQAKTELNAAFTDIASRTEAAAPLSGDIGGRTLSPGVYQSASSLSIEAGKLTLDARGDANAVFILKSPNALTTATRSEVILTGKAKAANVFWQVGSSATLGTNAIFKGSILAVGPITLQAGAMLEGRAWSQSAAIVMDGNIVSVPAP